jgi:hypothetical protein
MEIDDSASLMYYTYYMMHWETLSQEPSETKCLACGRAMMKIEPVIDKKGVIFDGIVCHSCKTVLWAKRKGV